MAESRFNAPGGLTVGKTPINSIDASNNATLASLIVSGTSTLGSTSVSSLAVSGAASFSTIPTSVKPALNNNSTQLATTSWYFGQVSTVSPLMSSTASIGTSTLWARGDHRHPSDTSRLTVVNPSATGSLTVTSGTVVVDTPAVNVTQTWNGAGSFSAIKLVVTDTQSGSTSKALDITIGSNHFGVDKNGSVVQILAAPNIARDIVGVTGSRHVREYQDLNDYNVTQNIGGAVSNTENFEWGYTWNAKWDTTTSSYIKDRSNAGDHAVMMRTDKKFRQQWHWSDGTTAGSPIVWAKKVDFDFTNSAYTFDGTVSLATLNVSGNINTGTWNATTISIAKGGTGRTTIGTSNQFLGVDAAGTALEYKSFTSSDNSLSITYPSPGVVDIKLVGTIPGNVNFSGDLSVGGSSPNHKFLVLAASGNTDIKGTLTAAGATVLSSTLAVVSNFAVATNKFTVAAATGNTVVAGTLSVALATTLQSTLAVTSNFTVNTNRFTVDAATGNTLVAGTFTSSGAGVFSTTLGVTGNFAVATNKFTVAAATGNTVIAGTLSVTGAVTASSTLAVMSDFTVNTNKFVVTAASGNTAIAGTLAVSGATTLSTVSATSSVITNETSVNRIVRDNTGTDSAIVFMTNTLVPTAGTTTIATLDKATYRTAEFLVQGRIAGSNIYQNVKVLAVHDGASTVSYTEFGSVEIGGIAGTLSVIISGTNMVLQVTTTLANAQFKVITTAMK